MSDFYDENKDFLNGLTEELRSAVEDVITELNKFSKNSEFLPLSNVSEEILEKFLVKNSLTPSQEFKNAMTTPFAIAKYLVLLVQQKEAIEKVKNVLDILLAQTKISYTIYEDFSNQICFTKELEINSEEKPQCLVLKYRIDQEQDKVVFILPGNSWGWDINNTQLLAILTNKYADYTTIEKPVQKSSKEDVVLTFNGVDVILKKHY